MHPNGAEPPAPTPDEGDGSGPTGPAGPAGPAPGPRLTASRRERLVVIGLLAAIVAFAFVRQRITWTVVLFLGALVPSVILHEVSHGAVALLFGDDTAKRAGRLTLNPLNHIDPVGTLVLPAILFVVTGFGFGYAKPVPVNPARMRDPRNHSLLVSLAGPAVNIVIAVAAAIAARLFLSPFDTAVASGFRLPDSVLAQLILTFGVLNVVLAVFNLIPLPPLDGSAVVERALPARLWPAYLRVRPYSMLLILGVLVLFRDGFGLIFGPAIDVWASLAF